MQCKRWSQQTTNHEKHVFQLFGTVVALRIEQPGTPVSGTFTTTTTLSERAHQFAEQLGVRVEERQPLNDSPRIKRNVARDGQRIYHLPFDQQYDATVVEPEKGECWVPTVAESETLGFRRAWRWKRRDCGGLMNARERRRRAHKPDELRVLFIGESPLAGGTFFYDANSLLYQATREAFMAAAPRLASRDFLTTFQHMGCYLADPLA